MVRLTRNKKQTYRLNSMPQIWPLGLTLVMTLTLNFQGQTWNLLHLSQEMVWLPQNEKQTYRFNLGIKCDHQIWPWPWPWPWIYKVKYGICYISTKSGPKIRCKDLPDSDQGDFRCLRAVDSSSLYTHFCDFTCQKWQNKTVQSIINSLGPSDAMWWQRSVSPLAQVMACCLTAPSHYLNQCWLVISEVKWHTSKGKFTRETSAINHWNYLEN